MKKLEQLIALLLFIIPAPGWTQGARTNIIPNRLSFYAVQLVCPATTQIGCGSAAKPILMHLERNADISEAWLNRRVTIIAVVWKQEVAPKQHAKVIASIMESKTVE